MSQQVLDQAHQARVVAIRPDVPIWTASSVVVVAGISFVCVVAAGPIGLIVAAMIAAIVHNANYQNAVMISADMDATEALIGKAANDE